MSSPFLMMNALSAVSETRKESRGHYSLHARHEFARGAYVDLSYATGTKGGGFVSDAGLPFCNIRGGRRPSSSIPSVRVHRRWATSSASSAARASPTSRCCRPMSPIFRCPNIMGSPSSPATLSSRRNVRCRTAFRPDAEGTGEGHDRPQRRLPACPTFHKRRRVIAKGFGAVATSISPAALSQLAAVRSRAPLRSGMGRPGRYSALAGSGGSRRFGFRGT